MRHQGGKRHLLEHLRTGTTCVQHHGICVYVCVDACRRAARRRRRRNHHYRQFEHAHLCHSKVISRCGGRLLLTEHFFSGHNNEQCQSFCEQQRRVKVSPVRIHGLSFSLYSYRSRDIIIFIEEITIESCLRTARFQVMTKQLHVHTYVPHRQLSLSCKPLWCHICTCLNRIYRNIVRLQCES